VESAFILTIIIASCAIPFLHHTRIEFPISERYSLSAYGDAWVGFTEIVLALSGIEAIANMTGIMVPPVRSTSKRSIIPVLGEVIILNLLLGAAMNALPDAKLIDPQGNPLGTDNMMNILAESYVGPTFAMLSAFIFGALLLSAVNTAVTDLVAIQYMMAKDGEAPNILAKLNRHGVPGLALLVAMAIPALLLVLFPDLTQLAGLYSVGVVAAITINLLSTAFTRQFDLISWERWLLGSVGILMAAILVTLLWNKPNARAFSMAVLNIGLSARIFTQVGKAQLTPQWRLRFRIFAIASLLGQLAITVFVPAELIWPFVASAVVAATLIVAGKYLFNTIPNQNVPAQPENLDGDYEPNDTYLVEASHPTFQFESVMTEARNNKAGVTVLFVKELALPQMGSNSLHLPAEDALAKDIFSHAENPARRLGVPLTLVYLAGGSVSERIVSIARDCKATRLYMQLSRRTAVQRFFKGDVIGPVAEKIPPEMELIIRG
jgi:L-asparagine transporter-like permease